MPANTGTWLHWYWVSPTSVATIIYAVLVGRIRHIDVKWKYSIISQALWRQNYDITFHLRKYDTHLYIVMPPECYQCFRYRFSWFSTKLLSAIYIRISLWCICVIISLIPHFYDATEKAVSSRTTNIIIVFDYAYTYVFAYIHIVIYQNLDIIWLILTSVISLHFWQVPFQ